jgi:lipopolysaccharide transport system ATP-binding protein
MLDLEGAGTALRVDNVTKTFRVHQERATSLKQFVASGGRNRYEDFFALRNVSFDVHEGEAVGIIGHNGSGKSTLLKCMAKILTPNEGHIEVNKKMAALLELGAGFHQELSGRDNVFLNASILGMGRKDIAARFDEIADFAGLGEFIESPVKTYSSGMYVRLAFAVAINVDPELLLIDEILAVGDVTFQKKCMEKFVDFRTQGRTLVLVTHDAYTVREFCDRAIWLDHGVVRRDGDPADVVDEYTETMLGAETTEGAEGSRRGDGRIKVTRTELLVGGVPVDRFRNGDDVTVRLHWEAEQPVPKPVFSVTIASLAGATVTAPSSRDVGQVPDSLVGSGHVDVQFAGIPLVASRYVLHTEITGWGRQHVHDHVQNAQTFDVIAGTSNETHGLVTLHPTWSGLGT